MSDSDVRQYSRRVWTIVVLRMIVDACASLLIIGVISLLTTGLVMISGGSLGMTFLHVRQSAVILGGIYLFVIWMRTLRRHWTIAGDVKGDTLSPTPQASEVSDAQPSATASN